MTDIMEWILIFLMFYIFCSMWLISYILDNILKILREMEQERNK